MIIRVLSWMPAWGCLGMQGHGGSRHWAGHARDTHGDAAVTTQHVCARSLCSILHQAPQRGCEHPTSRTTRQDEQ